MDSPRTLLRSAGAMSAATLLSRIFGYVRDLLMAALLGAAGSSDAFIIALRIPNLLRRLVGEGALTAAFVPTFSRHLQENGPRASARFVGRAFGTLGLILAAMTGAGILLSPWVVRLVAWGFQGSAGKWELTVSLNRLMFPYLLFIGLAALAMGVLNSLRSFAVPAFTPVLLNLSMIAAAALLARRMEEPAYAFAIGVLVGGFLQFAFQVPFILRKGIPLRPAVSFRDPQIRRVGRLMIPGFIGVGVYQVNLIVDAQFASFLGDGSVSWLYYGDRITELVLGLFAISLSTVVLPALSRQVVEGKPEQVRATLSLALRLVGFVSVPATLGLIVLREPIVAVLFQRGEFTSGDAAETARALLGYSLGLLPFSAVKILAPAFYAHQDTATPVKVAAACFVFHVAACFALIGPFRHAGIATATSLASALNTTLLMVLLRRRMGPGLWGGALLRGAARLLAAGGIMAAGILLFVRWLPFPGAAPTALRGGWLALAIAAGAGLYAASHLALRGPELRELRAALSPSGEGR